MAGYMPEHLPCSALVGHWGIIIQSHWTAPGTIDQGHVPETTRREAWGDFQK